MANASELYASYGQQGFDQFQAALNQTNSKIIGLLAKVVGVKGMDVNTSGLKAIQKDQRAFDPNGRSEWEIAEQKGKIEKATALELAKLDKERLSENKRVSGEVNQSIQQFGNQAKKIFAGLLAGVGGSVALGDSRTFQDFKVSLEILSRVIGVTLAPVIHDFTNYIMQLAEWFNNLSPTTHQLIATFAKWGIVIAGVALVVPKVIGMVQMLGSAVMAMGLQAAIAAAAILAAYLLLKRIQNKNEEVDQIQKDANRRVAGNLTAGELQSQEAMNVAKGGTQAEQLELARKQHKALEAELKQKTAKFVTRSHTATGAAVAQDDEEYMALKEIQRKAGIARGLVTNLEKGQTVQQQQKAVEAKDDAARAERKKTGQQTPADKALENFLYEQRKPSQLIGLADAWRKAQTSNVESPELRYQRQMVEYLRRIADKEAVEMPPVGAAP